MLVIGEGGGTIFGLPCVCWVCCFSRSSRFTCLGSFYGVSHTTLLGVCVRFPYKVHNGFTSFVTILLPRHADARLRYRSVSCKDEGVLTDRQGVTI